MTNDWPTIGALAERARVVHGRRLAVIDGKARHDYRTLVGRAFALASGLRSAGFPEGARIAYLGDNAHFYMEAYLGLPAAGFVLVPLNSRLAAAEIAGILDDCDAVAVIAGAGFEECALEAAGATRPVIGTNKIEELIASGSSAALDIGAPGDIAYLYYTSGTTGRPKGVMLSHANVLSGSLGAATAMGLGSETIWLHAGPMFHLADAFAIWSLVWLGGRHVCTRFNPDEAIRLIEAEGVTHSLLVPTAADMLASAAQRAGTRLASLTTLFYGGAPMPRPVLERIMAALDANPVPTYGMTETSGIITCGYPGDAPDPENPIRVGHEAPLVTLTLCNDDGVPVADGDIGEIVVSGPSVTSGYLNRDIETRDAFRDGALLTGDLGRRDADGALLLVDRKKDMIITGGENVYPREVELVLETHPDIAEVAVIARPDPTWGEMVCAVIRPRDGATISLDALQDFARPRLAGYKLPRRLEIRESFPRTASGKIAKSFLTSDTNTGNAPGKENP